MNKSFISNILRSLGLIKATDDLRFRIEKFRYRKKNARFRQEFPEAKLPPDYLIYESFKMDYYEYYKYSRNTAGWLAGLMGKHIELKDKDILDWGCGPGRIIRHMPGVIANGCRFYGTDYNERSVKWCSENLPDVKFSLNKLHPPLSYPDASMDALYGLSIFTHLSEEMHYAWRDELYRVLRPGGIALITMQGQVFKTKLSPAENKLFDLGKLVVRGKVKEGHRTYSAFHPESFMKDFVKPFVLLEHIPGELSNKPQQDIYILGKG